MLVHQSQDIESLESKLLSLPQTECPVVHHFGPGIYVREVTLPAGAIAIGHHQKHQHLNIMLTGKVIIQDNSGGLKTLEAPLIFTGEPGRKVGYVVSTCTWQNIYPNPDNCRDIDELESRWLEKSQTWVDHNESQYKLESEARESDRQDFLEVIEAAGFTEPVVRAQSVDTSDQIPFPEGMQGKLTIRKSPIEGLGVFLSTGAVAGEILAPARLSGMRTPAGRYVNHSKTPNAEYITNDRGDIYLMATKSIAGCTGGNQGEEVVVDYRQALSLSGIKIGRTPS